MSPLQLSILLHYKCAPYDYNNGDFSAPAVRDAIDKFRDKSDSWTISGMLVPSFPEAGSLASYTLSEKGEVFVKALCELQPPILVWVMPDNT